MTFKQFTYVLVLIGFIGIWACGTKSEYRKIVERELASGERHDNIFMGFHIGMPEKVFYDSCTALNKRRLVYQGARDVTVSFKMDILDKEVDVYFFPNFHEKKIYEMEVSYSYYGWSPWRKELSAEKLMFRLLAIYEKTYGEGFIEIKSPQDRVAYVKVDGNRRISIYEKDDQTVRVIFTDLRVEKIAEKNKPKVVANAKNKPIWWKDMKKE